MTYITGDTHGDFSRYIDFTKRMRPTKEDVMIVLGDAGLNYYGDIRDEGRKRFVGDFPFTTFCIHGNHEMRPYEAVGYKTKAYRGGVVWYHEEQPNILFAKDGEVFDFDGFSCMVIGGAYSVDKYIRLARGWNWFASEQPSNEIKTYVERQFDARGRKVDIILSHTCPLKYEPVEMFITNIDQGAIDKSTEEWLDGIEESVDYRKWYCGHFHTAKKTHRMQFMFTDIDVLGVK